MTIMRQPTRAGVRDAAAKIAEILPPSPLMVREINGLAVAFKMEALQPVGSFKLRGAWHRLTALCDESRSRGGLHAGESASPYEPGADLWRRYEEASPAARLVVDLVLNRRTMAAATNETLQAALKTALLAAGEAPADGELGAGKTKAA